MSNIRKINLHDEKTQTAQDVASNGAAKVAEESILAGSVLPEATAGERWKTLSTNGGTGAAGAGDHLLSTGVIADGEVVFQSKEKATLAMGQPNHGNIGVQLTPGSLSTDTAVEFGCFDPIEVVIVQPADINTALVTTDAVALYNSLSAATHVNEQAHAAAIPTETLNAGIYTFAAAGTQTLNTTLTLNGGADDIFIFRFTSTFVMGAGIDIVLTGGAQASNVFWVAEGALTTGITCNLQGTYISNIGGIGIAAGCTLKGRLDSRTAAITTTDLITTYPGLSTTEDVGLLDTFSLFCQAEITNALVSNISGDIGTHTGTLASWSTSTVGGDLYVNATSITPPTVPTDLTNTTANGVFFRVLAGVWSIVTVKGGVETPIAFASWTGVDVANFDATPDFATYEIRYNTGLIELFQDDNLVHSISALAASYAETYKLPVALRIANSNGNTIDRSINVRTGGIYRLGKVKSESISRTFTETTLVSFEAGRLTSATLSRSGSSGTGTLTIYDGVNVASKVIGVINLAGDGTENLDIDTPYYDGLYIVVSGTGINTVALGIEQ